MFHSWDIYSFAALLSLVFLAVTVELIRRRKLKEQYALLWLAVIAIMLVFSFQPGILDALAQRFRVVYAPSLLFLLGLAFSFALILHYSVIISKLSSQVLRLSQEVAILNQKMEQGKTEGGDHDS